MQYRAHDFYITRAVGNLLHGPVLLHVYVFFHEIEPFIISMTQDRVSIS
jgi:hypothetical protein